MVGSELGRNRRSENVGTESVCNAEDRIRVGKIPGKGNDYSHSIILAWRIPWIEEQEWGSTE